RLPPRQTPRTPRRRARRLGQARADAGTAMKKRHPGIGIKMDGGRRPGALSAPCLSERRADVQWRLAGVRDRPWHEVPERVDQLLEVPVREPERTGWSDLSGEEEDRPLTGDLDRRAAVRVGRESQDATVVVGHRLRRVAEVRVLSLEGARDLGRAVAE